jgi:chorismate synthase
VTVEVKGRHDPCIVPRAVPVVEAMTALVIADCLLIQDAGLAGR